MKNFILEKEYIKIIETMPICCIDLLIVKNKKFLLILRKNEPEKNRFWFPGGRIYKNEKLKEAAIRIAKQEVGLKINNIKLIGVYDYISKKSRFKEVKTGTHTPVILYLVKPKDSKVILDSNHLDYKWAQKIEKNFHPYIKKVLKDSKIF